MKRIVVFLAFLTAFGSCVAEPVASQDGDTIRLHERPCADEAVLALLAAYGAPIASKFQAASTIVGGKTFGACWMVRGRWVLLQYADGDQGQVPISDFKDDPGT